MKTYSYSRGFQTLFLYFPLEGNLLHCCNSTTKTSTPWTGQGQSYSDFYIVPELCFITASPQVPKLQEVSKSAFQIYFYNNQAGFMLFFFLHFPSVPYLIYETNYMWNVKWSDLMKKIKTTWTLEENELCVVSCICLMQQNINTGFCILFRNAVGTIFCIPMSQLYSNGM